VPRDPEPLNGERKDEEEELGLFFDERIGELTGPAHEDRSEAPPGKRPNNVAGDRYDRRLHRELSEKSGDYARTRREGEDLSPQFPSLLEDFFRAFYKAGPELAPEEEVSEAELRKNRPFVERLLENPDTRSARAYTRLDELSAAVSAIAAGRKAIEEIREDEDLAAALGEEPDEEPPGPEDGEEAPAGGGGDGAADHDEDGEASLPAGAPGPLARQPGPSARAAKRLARAAAEVGAEEAERLASALASWGLSTADLSPVPLGERVELARRLTGPDLRRLTDLVGKMSALARARAKAKLKDRSGERSSVEIGRPEDLSRLLPTELAALASPVPGAELLFYARYAERRLLYRDVRAKEKAGRGPMIAMIDRSRSMAGPKMEWATAVALAAVRLASGAAGAQRRRSCVLFFDEEVVLEERFEPKERDARKMLRVATVNADGGTGYEAPLTRALEIAAESAYRGADFLLVTDAICRLSEEFVERLLAEKERRGISVYSVLIGSRRTAELARYSDEVHALSSVSGGGPAADRASEAAARIFERLA
jgi:uncharacterized protein with von Willebrand factor type A (vWA) domain